MVTGGWRGPGWQVFDADTRNAGQARHSITSAIARHACQVDIGDAAMCITELVANALEHGPAGGRVLAGYCLWERGARLIVCDSGGPGTPRIVQAAEHDLGGRGLQVVAALAARWGSFLLPAARVVWCDLGEPLRAAPGDAWAWLGLVLSMESLSAPPGAAATAGLGTLAGAR